MLHTMSNSILSTPSGRRCRQLTMAFAALAALATIAPTAQANTSRQSISVVRSGALSAKKVTKPKVPSRYHGASMANYAAGFMTRGNNVPQGGNRYEPGFAGWADFALGYKASHPEAF
jgi:hypothetical protein